MSNKVYNSVLFLQTVSANVKKMIHGKQKQNKKRDQANNPMPYKSLEMRINTICFLQLFLQVRFWRAGGRKGRKSALLVSSMQNIKWQGKRKLSVFEMQPSATFNGGEPFLSPKASAVCILLSSLLLLCTRDTIGTVTD